MSDKLETIFELQKLLQDKVGTFEKIGNDPKMKQQFINQMILALHEEAVEIMRESAYKNPDYVPFGWKKGQKANNEKFKDEIVDLLHHTINLCLVSGMDSDELYRRYVKKNKENHERV